MRKATSAVVLVTLLSAAILLPLAPRVVRAQTQMPVSCSGTPLATPMQGHFAGTWHSDGDYHFLALGHDIELHLTIDGTIDAIVSADGQMTGTVQGSVDAPLTHDGQKDISSGKGTITGTLTGLYGAGGGTVVLTAPVILMHWGTFAAGGYTADRYITMPDYQFAIGGMDCVSAHGTISETNFPVQYIVADFQGGLAQAPGIGAATGTWQLTSDAAGAFTDLSQQVDSFIARSNALLGDPAGSLTPNFVSTSIAQPLRALEDAIRKNPSIARCLLDRLGAWQAALLQPLLQRAQQISSTADLVSLRRGGDLLRSAHLLNLNCAVDESPASSVLASAGMAAVDRTIAARDWAGAVLAARETVLLGGDASRATLQGAIDARIRVLVQTSTGSAALLELARASYLLGDPADSSAALKAVVSRPRLVTRAAHRNKKKKKPKHITKPKPTATARPKPTATPTQTPLPTATATPTPKTLEQVLSTGIVHMVGAVSSGTIPTIQWQPVNGATHYVVAVSAGSTPHLLWGWAGQTTGVTYGDTTLPGVSGTESDGWSVPFDSTACTWSVLALNANGQIVGAAFGAK